MANYINQEELLQELKISKENDQLTRRAVEMLQEMIKRQNRVMSYKNPMDREDVKSRAMLDILLYWRSFNPDLENSNVFSFFSQMIKYGSAKGFNELYPEIKEGTKIIPISEEDGIFNI